MLTGHERKPRSGNAKQLVVILHGWGADGANLIDLADLWANSLPDAHFCAPNAHEICEVNPYGFQWFSLADRSPLEMRRGVEAAALEVNAFLDAKLKELSISTPTVYEPRSDTPTVYGGGKGGASSVNAGSPPFNSPPQAVGIKLALAGFSQGTMTALNVGLRRDDVACVLGYSGALLEDESSIREITHKPPVCLIHGEQDDIVPFASMARAAELLKSQHVEVQTHARPGLGHSIDMEGIAIGGKFLSGVVAG